MLFRNSFLNTWTISEMGIENTYPSWERTSLCHRHILQVDLVYSESAWQYFKERKYGLTRKYGLLSSFYFYFSLIPLLYLTLIKLINQLPCNKVSNTWPTASVFHISKSGTVQSSKSGVRQARVELWLWHFLATLLLYVLEFQFPHLYNGNNTYL